MKALTPVETETERILVIANSLFMAPDKMLIAIVRDLKPRYFWEKDNDDVSLVETDRERVTKVYRFAAAYVSSEIMKQIICGQCLVFLKQFCSEAEIQSLKDQTGYDPASFSIFDDLG